MRTETVVRPELADMIVAALNILDELNKTPRNNDPGWVVVKAVYGALHGAGMAPKLYPETTHSYRTALLESLNSLAWPISAAEHRL